MMKKFLATFLILLGYMAVMAGLLLLILSLQNNLSQQSFIIAIVVFAIALLVSFFVIFFTVVRKIWFFPGNGTPVELSELKKQLLGINNLNVPIVAKEGEGGGLVFTWNYVDAKWWEIMAKAGLDKVYELRVKFNDKKHEVTMVDITSSLSWRAGTAGVDIGQDSQRGIIMGFEIGKQWGIRENFSIGKVYDFKFNPAEVKGPVMNTILNNGWNVRFGIL